MKSNKVRIRPEKFYGGESGFTKADIKLILDDMHRNFNVTEIEVNGVTYRWPMIIHDKDCR